MREASRQARMTREAIIKNFIDGEVDLSTKKEELGVYEEPSRKARQNARLIRREKLKNSVEEKLNEYSKTIKQHEQLPKKAEKKNKGKGKHKRSPLLISAILLIVFGMIVLLYPIVGNILANQERSEARTTYDNSMKKMSQEKKDAAWELAEEYNKYIYSLQEGRVKSEVEYKKVLDLGDTKNNVMGTIDIPAIDIVQLPFYHGTDMKTLDKGLGHFQPSSVPVGGVNTRSVITGHSGVKNQVLFTDIRNLKEGDLFFINVLGKRLAYEIDSFEEILPSEVEKVKITPGRDVVTLLTCTPPGINTYRLLVNGHRIPYAKAEKMPINKRNFWSYQSIVLSSLLFCFVVFMILYLLHRYFMKKSKSEDETIRNKAKKRMKHLIYVTRALFVTLLVTMIGVLVVAIYGYLLMKQNTELPPVQVGETSQLASYTPDKILNGDYEGKEIASVNIANYAEAKKNMQKNVNDWGVGKLYIPSQEINLPILAGLKNENLLNGASTFRQDQKLGLDNYVLLAHNIYETDVLFNRISELKKGEEIYATDFQDIYIYKVFENKVVRDTEVDVVERRKEGESPIITLIRCEGNIGTIYRRIVQGEFVKTIPLSEAKQTSKPLLQEMKLEMSGTPKNGIYLKDPPISVFHLFCMNLAANILADPMQVLIPLVLLLVLPILFLAII